MRPGAPSPLAALLVTVLGGYRRLSALSVPRCRYYPSCSAYAVDALRVHGAIKGTGLAAWRVLRCNPFSVGGIDYVPGSPVHGAQ